MNYQNILKKQTSIILISVIFMILIIIGVSYSLFMQVNESTNIQVLESGTLVLSSTEGTTITTSTIPQSDYDGMSTEGYTFSIKNTGTLDCYYTLYISNVATDPLDYQYLRISIDGNEPILLTDLDVDPEDSSRFIFETGYLSPANQYNDVITHNIKVWIDELAPASIIGKNIQLQVDLYGEMVESNMTEPELYAGLIPITYDEDTNVVIADTNEEWYNYNNHKWANAILIDQSNADIKNKYINTDGSYIAGTIVDTADILQMYVWIPRYRYQLFNVNGESIEPQMINIIFENNTTPKSNSKVNGGWLTHPAFTFGNTELNGIWVGKFESSGATDNLTIIPNGTSLTNINVSTMFNASRAIETTIKYGLSASEVDTHMMKNMEWGAVAYLTNSKYGIYIDASTCMNADCEVWINNNSSYTTGCAGDSVSAASASTCNAWNTSIGVNASTTGTIYGIYDMSGGAFEYVMGNMVDSSGTFYPSDSGFTEAHDSKYYDSYAYGESSSDYTRGQLGDATKEVLADASGGYAWNSDYALFVASDGPWFRRGGYLGLSTLAGVFSFYASYGSANSYTSFRVVLGSE